MTVFRLLLVSAVCLCLAGIIRRYARRLSGSALPRQDRSRGRTPWQITHILLHLPVTLITDVLLLRRTLRTSPYRWVMHALTLSGFTGLLLFHALDDVVSRPFIAGYESTLDPWQWLRNLLGGLVVAGCLMALVRRLRTRGLRPATRLQDWLFMGMVAGIVLSGFALEATKIISPNVFNRMTDTYFVPESDADIPALQAFWSARNGVRFSPPAGTDAELIARGAELHADNCSYCHADTSSAFLSRALATAISPAADALNAAQTDAFFWFLHVGLALAGLALLPYGKFLHPVATPLNLVLRNRRHDAATIPDTATAARLGFEACTRCGECSLHCSVAPHFAAMGNPNILPSEKLVSLRKHAAGALDTSAINALAEGSRICTECMRCTDICPSGINLQDLWLSSKQALRQQALDGPNTTIRQCTATQWAEVLRTQGASRFEQVRGNGLADRAESFWGCVQCTTCTSVCPVVAVSEAPAKDLDLTPQQIMNLLRMGLKDQTLAARMVWSCTTCYKCQEHCPQNIQVADILFELRQIATERLRERDLTACPLPGPSAPARAPMDNALPHPAPKGSSGDPA